MEDTRTEAERAYDATRLSPLTAAEKRAIARQADQALAAHFARRAETEDTNALIDVLSGLPADPRPITVEKLYRDPTQGGDLVEEARGPLAYVDYAIGINFEGGEHDDDRAWISFCVAETPKPHDYTCPMVGLCDGEALPLHLVERAFVNFQRLMADPRVQAMVKASGTIE